VGLEEVPECGQNYAQIDFITHPVPESFSRFFIAWKEPTMSKANLVVVAFLVFGTGLSGCKQKTESTAPEFLAVDESELIVGPKQGKLYIFLDVFANREILNSLSEKEATQLLHRTGVHLCEQCLAKEKYRKFMEGTVDIVSIANKNEYGNGDFSSMVRHGSLSVTRKPSGNIGVSAETLQYRRSGS
jgi:hypothetical protein